MYSPQRNTGYEKSSLGKTKKYSTIRKPFNSSSPNRDSLWHASPTKRATNDNSSSNITLDEFMLQKRKRAKIAPSSAVHIPRPTVRKSIVNSNSNRLVRNKNSVYKPTTRPHKVPVPSNNYQSNLNRTAATARSKPTAVLSRNTANNATTTLRIDNTLSSSSTDIKIRVCVRKRPLTKEEVRRNEQDVVPLSSTKTIQVHAPKQKVDLTNYTEHHAFTFDDVFDSDTPNKTIYQRTTRPLVDHIFQGGKATCFAYGQTGSGKTYTMLDPKHGLYFQATNDIFQLLKQPQHQSLEAHVGYYEIYQGQLFDLLNNRRRLIPREDGKSNIIISGLKEYRIRTAATMMQVFDVGNRERTTCKTHSNDTSSRSHAVLQILLKQPNKVFGKLNFIDLAGSERGTDRGMQADAKTRMEGAEINRSLLALKECIRALDQEKRHAPFRGSKLTMVLRDSFVGNSKTCMIATVSPNHSNSDHTLNTLRYADRVKELRGESDPRLHVDKEGPVTSTAAQSSDTNHSGLLLPPSPSPVPKITKSHIKKFIHAHKVQVEAVETYLKGSIQLANEFERDYEELSKYKSTVAEQILAEKYIHYTTELDYKGNKVAYFVDILKNKIKEELADEEEEEEEENL